MSIKILTKKAENNKKYLKYSGIKLFSWFIQKEGAAAFG